MTKTIPSVKEPIADTRGGINASWYRFFVQVRTDFASLTNNVVTNDQATASGQFLQRDGVVVLYRYPKFPSFTVAALPSASTQGAGTKVFVTDANATTFNSVVAGGGANKVPVFSDGTAWRIG